MLDAVTDTATGELLTPADLPARLADARLVLVGEGHTEMDTHRVELRVLEELQRAGRSVLVGLEMYPYPEQRWLDDWTAGKLSEDAFLDGSRWYRNWGYNWLYYRDIFLFARDHHLRMFAVNAPREVVAAVRQKGFQGLTPEEAAHIPTQIDTKSADHLRLFKAEFAEASFHVGRQRRAVAGDAECPVHVGRDDGLERRRRPRQGRGPEERSWSFSSARATCSTVSASSGRRGSGFRGRIASVIPVPVEDEKTGPVRAVQASYANFVWGIPPRDGLALSGPRPRHPHASPTTRGSRFSTSRRTRRRPPPASGSETCS